MRYICRECKATFSENEIVTMLEEMEYYDGSIHCGSRDICPECGSEDFTEEDNCSVCGNLTEADDLYGGICLHCLVKALTVEVGLKYLEATQKVEEFTEWIGASIEDLPRPALLEGLQDFILDNDEAKAFAEWLEETECI